jgi:hypothetical protein
MLLLWYRPTNPNGGGHPSWPLEVTGNSGLFLLVHLETLWLSLVPILMNIGLVEKLCCPFHEWSGCNLLNYS